MSLGEVRKYISGYEGLYSVTTDGRVYSHPRMRISGHKINGKYLARTPSEKGYLRVNLFKDGSYKTFKIHRLVAETFIPNPNGKPEVNHLDGDKSNNRVENLEWSTSLENLRHAFQVGLKTTKGASNPRAKLTNLQVKDILSATGLSQRALAKRYGVSQAQISSIRQGKSWAHLNEGDLV
ncbi:HNH endonuclease [Enterobacter bugandensis]